MPNTLGSSELSRHGFLKQLSIYALPGLLSQKLIQQLAV